ncbi:MAG: sugar nucleotide-binding protein [Limisphaerales bacterium]
MSHSHLAWITGAGGLIGSELVKTAPQFAPRYIPRGLGRKELDLLDFEAVSALFRVERPALIIHCAALSQFTTCEAHPTFAKRANIEMTERLLALGSEIPFVFFSTDLIFDGTKRKLR